MTFILGPRMGNGQGERESKSVNMPKKPCNMLLTVVETKNKAKLLKYKTS